MYHHVQVRLAEERFLHRKERFPTGEIESFSSERGSEGEKKDNIDSTFDTPDTVKAHRDRLARQTREVKEGHHRDSRNDEELFTTDQLKQSKKKLYSVLKVIRPVNS